MVFDFFVGALRCPRCDRVSRADSSTNIQTYIREVADVSELRVGAFVDASPENLQDSEYMELHPPGGGERRILSAWECPTCGWPWNWAVIVVRGGVIREISAVAMNSETLSSAHYIHDQDARFLIMQQTGRPWEDFQPLGAQLDALRALEASKEWIKPDIQENLRGELCRRLTAAFRGNDDGKGISLLKKDAADSPETMRILRKALDDVLSGPAPDCLPLVENCAGRPMGGSEDRAREWLAGLRRDLFGAGPGGL
jgi:hypothetical protein